MPSDKEGKPKAVGQGDGIGPISAQSNPPRKLTAVACIDCRKRKRKCNGNRPSCSACQARGLTCLYDVVEGATRTEDLKQKVQSLTARTRNLEIFINKLRYGTDNEASAYLAQLRLGDSVDKILEVEMESILGPDLIDGEQRRVKRFHSSSNDETESLRLLANYGATSSSSDSMSVPTTINTTLYNDSQSMASMSIASGKVSPNTQHDVQQGMHQDSSWAAVSLFVDIDSQHLLYEERPQAETRETTWECESISTGISINGGQRRHSLYGQTPETTGHTTGSERQAKTEERWRIRNQLYLDRNKGAEAVVVSSHLFRGIGNLPLSTPVQLLSSSQPDWPTPAWAITSMYERDGAVVTRVYTDFIDEKKGMIDNGVPPEQIFGTSPEVEALANEEAFQRASSLSRWAAQHANSFGISSLVCRSAVMWLNWHLMRWLIHPTPVTYAAIPIWYRPTPYQLFHLHPVHLDFNIWPLFRDGAIQRVDLQTLPRYWYTEVGRTAGCNWHGSLEDSLCYDSSTGRLALNLVFVQHISDLTNWTIGPVIRKYIPDADLFMQIKYGLM